MEGRRQISGPPSRHLPTTPAATTPRQVTRTQPIAAPPTAAAAHLCLPQELAARDTQEARLRAAPQVKHHLEQRGALRMADKRVADVGGQHLQQRVQVVPHDDAAVLLRHAVALCCSGKGQ